MKTCDRCGQETGNGWGYCTECTDWILDALKEKNPMIVVKNGDIKTEDP